MMRFSMLHPGMSEAQGRAESARRAGTLGTGRSGIGKVITGAAKGAIAAGALYGGTKLIGTLAGGKTLGGDPSSPQPTPGDTAPPDVTANNANSLGKSIAQSMAPGIIPALAGYAGASNTNAANAAIMAQQMNFQQQMVDQKQSFDAAQIKAARRYNTKMSNSAVQRRMRDLEKAGINPILAAGSQASAPSSPVASGQTAPGSAIQAVNEVQPALNSALNAMSTLAQVNNLRANTALTLNEVKKTDVTRRGYEELGKQLDKYGDNITEGIGSGVQSLDEALTRTIRNIQIIINHHTKQSRGNLLEH